MTFIFVAMGLAVICFLLLYCIYSLTEENNNLNEEMLDMMSDYEEIIDGYREIIRSERES